MLRLLIVSLVLGAAVMGAPNLPAPDPSLWREYGWDAHEPVPGYAGQAWRFKDSTGALAAFDSLRPREAKPAPLGRFAVRYPGGALIAHGNYLIRIEGRLPDRSAWARLLEKLPRLETGPLPSLPNYLPPEGLVPNSERYITGPTALQMFAPGLNPGLVGLDQGAEAVTGEYEKGVRLVLVAYPTPGIARTHAAGLEKAGWKAVKRSGPLLGLVLTPADAQGAQKVLSRVNYEANLVWNEKAPDPAITRKVGSMLMSIFELAGILLLVCIGGGLFFGLIRIAARQVGNSGAEGPITVLHLSEK